MGKLKFSWKVDFQWTGSYRIFIEGGLSVHQKSIFYDNSSGVLSVAMNFWLYAYAGSTHGTWGLIKMGDTALVTLSNSRN